MQAHPGVRLREHTTETVIHWLEAQGRNPLVPDWQLRQQADALRLLFAHHLRLEWAKTFDWNGWMQGSKGLEANHPTLARSSDMIEKAVAATDNSLGARFPALYRRFLTLVRSRGYSVNTEKAYLGWINRYLLFHKDKDPFVGTEQAVGSFLEYLALKRKVASTTQAQALNALVFLFAQVLKKPLGDIGPFLRANRPRHLMAVVGLKPVGLDEHSGRQAASIKRRVMCSRTSGSSVSMWNRWWGPVALSIRACRSGRISA